MTLRAGCDYFQMWKVGFSFLRIDNAKQSPDRDIVHVFYVTLVGRVTEQPVQLYLDMHSTQAPDIVGQPCCMCGTHP